jgi:tellurium resistance protein TerD
VIKYIQEKIKRKLGRNNKMAINLTKGGNINLTKAAPGATVFRAELGWNANQYDGAEFDLDASAAILNEGGKILSDSSFVFFNNPKDPTESVASSGDNRTGEGDGPDEVITVNVAKLPIAAKFVRLAITIYDWETRKQNFGQVSNAYVQVVNDATGEVIARYDLSEDFSIETCVVIGEFYENNGDWKFKAVGAGYGGGLDAYVAGIN